MAVSEDCAEDRKDPVDRSPRMAIFRKLSTEAGDVSRFDVPQSDVSAKMAYQVSRVASSSSLSRASPRGAGADRVEDGIVKGGVRLDVKRRWAGHGRSGGG